MKKKLVEMEVEKTRLQEKIKVDTAEMADHEIAPTKPIAVHDQSDIPH